MKTEGVGLELWHSGRILDFSDLEGCSRGGCLRCTVQEQCVHWGFFIRCTSSHSSASYGPAGQSPCGGSKANVTEESGVGT